jgi:hypothetical protein
VTWEPSIQSALGKKMARSDASLRDLQTMSDATFNETDILSRMDESNVTKQHWKVMFISGMGFFTDAYDLFIIGVVISI